MLCVSLLLPDSLFFFFNDTATTEIYTLSLHDALPISRDLGGYPTVDGAQTSWRSLVRADDLAQLTVEGVRAHQRAPARLRSEEHTSELQSRSDLVCRLLLEKKEKLHTDRAPPVNNHTP